MSTAMVTSTTSFNAPVMPAEVTQPAGIPVPGAPPLPFGAPTSSGPSTASSSGDGGGASQLLLYALAMAGAALLGLRAGRLHLFGAVTPRSFFVSAIERPG